MPAEVPATPTLVPTDPDGVSDIERAGAPPPAPDHDPRRGRGASPRPRRSDLEASGSAPPRRGGRDRAGAAAARRIRRDLCARVGEHRYHMWFDHTVFHVEDRCVEVAAGNSFVAKWIDAHFAADLGEIARAALGELATIDVRVVPELFGDDACSAAPAGTAHREAPASSGRAPVRARRPPNGSPSATPERRPAPRGRRTAPPLRQLEAFVVGPANRLAHSTACRLIEGEEGPGTGPLFVHGEYGVGKTHLLQGMCRRAAAAGRTEDIRYLTAEQFTNEYIAAIRSNTVDAFRRRVRKLDLLAIDDVHFLSNKMRTQGEVLHTLDAIALNGAKVVLSSDEHPRAIKKFSQALVSRFLSGMVVKVDRPDRAMRLTIVRRLAAARDLPIGDAAVEAVAARCVGSVRELEGAVVKLAALWSLTGSGAADEVGLVLVEQLFKDHGWQPPVPVRVDTVIGTVCRRIGIGRTDLMGTSRHRRVVLGRALVAYLGRTMTTLSYPELARALGRPYHSTVHTAEQRLRRQLEGKESVQTDEARKPIPLAELVDQLRHEITRLTARA